MHKVLVATPLHDWTVEQPYQFADGICIREGAPIRWDVAVSKTAISDDDQTAIDNSKYWLCAAKEYEQLTSTAGEELFQSVNAAAMALQVLCPTGGRHIFLRFQETKDGWDNTAGWHLKQLCTTFFGRTTSLDEEELTKHFDAIYAGIRRSDEEQVVRLQNPILLLEHGLQIGNAALGTLMFVMGLDVLFMAGENRLFIERIAGFLGHDTIIFPPNTQGYQPPVRVHHVIGDLYELRNIIAHGKEIPKTRYREAHNLTSSSGEPIGGLPVNYGDVLLNAALFLLTTTLRKIFTEGLFDQVADPKQWKKNMTVYEHRYKDTGGPALVKTHGK